MQAIINFDSIILYKFRKVVPHYVHQDKSQLSPVVLILYVREYWVCAAMQILCINAWKKKILHTIWQWVLKIQAWWQSYRNTTKKYSTTNWRCSLYYCCPQHEIDKTTNSHTAFTQSRNSNCHTGRSDVQTKWCIRVTLD